MLTFIKENKTTLLLVFICILFYGAFGYDLDRSDFIKLITLYGALFFLSYKIIQLNKGRFWFLVSIGILFRIVLIGVFPNLSQDYYRFIWDGRLVFQGINPYLFTPEQFSKNPTIYTGVVIEQSHELYQGMGTLNGSHFSNYPPFNQLYFTIASLFAGKSILGSVIVMRILIIFADIGILYFGRKLLIKLKQNPDKIFWYFLNPFIILELTGNLHFEGAMLFFLITSLYLLHQKKWIWSAVFLGISVSIKLIPLLLLPLYYKWFLNNFKKGFLKLILYHLIIVGIAVVTFTPFLSDNIIGNFTKTIALWFQDFEFNASIYYIIRWMGFKIVGWNLIETVGKVLPIIVIIFLLIISFIRNNKTISELITSLLFGISFYFLLSTTVHPWYIATPLLLCIFTKYRFPIVWSLVIMLSYSAYGINGFSENLWLVALEYMVVIIYFIWELINSKKETENSLNIF